MMIIDNREIPDQMIMRYCRKIKQLEIQYRSELEYARLSVHNEIFEYVKCERSLFRREDREFDSALNALLDYYSKNDGICKLSAKYRLIEVKDNDNR